MYIDENKYIQQNQQHIRTNIGKHKRTYTVYRFAKTKYLRMPKLEKKIQFENLLVYRDALANRHECKYR